jgi:hypothetical protein
MRSLIIRFNIDCMVDYFKKHSIGITDNGPRLKEVGAFEL